MDRREANPILVIAMLAVLVLLGINLYPGAIEKLRAQQLTNPVGQPTYAPAPVIINPVQQPQSQPAVMIVTATPLPVVAPEPTQVPPTQVPMPEPTVAEAKQEVATDGRFITFVSGDGTPVSGIVIEHYIGDDLVKTVTNPNGQMKVYTDYIRIYGGEWIYIEGLSLITVK